MRNLIAKSYQKLNVHNSGQLKNILLSFLFKGAGILVSFYIFRIGLLLIGNESMGVWLTISSISSWITFFDFGVGNGIKNKITEAIAQNNLKEAKTIISTGYFISIIISISLSLIFTLLSFIVDWNSLLNTYTIKPSILTIAILIALVTFSIRLSIDLVLVVMTAIHKAYYAAIVGFVSSVLSLLFLLILQYTQQKNFILFIVAIVIIPILPALIASFVFFSNKNKFLKPALSSYSKNYLRLFLTVGSSFFIIQLMYLVIFTTDNIIITKLFSPADVTIYNTAYKYFSSISFAFAILITPFWPAITKAQANGDTARIKKIIKTLLQYWLISIVLVLVMILIADWVYFVWTKNKVQVPFSLTIAMAIYIIVSTWNSIFATYLNAISKIKLQVYSSLFVGVMNIPLCYIFSKTFNWGVTGVIFATITCLLFSTIWSPIQYSLLISGKAKGIWNK